MKYTSKNCMLIAMLAVGIMAGITGCAKNEDVVSSSTEESTELGENEPEGEQPANEATSSAALFGLGRLEDIPAEFETVIEANQEALGDYQKQLAKEAGVVPTASRTALGHIIYTEQSRISNAYIFSGAELIETEVSVDLNSPDCPLYHEDRIYEALGRPRGSLKTQDGVLIEDDAAGWIKASSADTPIEKVLVNGDEIETLAVGEAWGNAEALRLRALTTADTVEDTKERAAPISAAFVVDGTQYTLLGSFGDGDLAVGFDGEATFAILVRKMVLPTNDGFAPDMAAYKALLAETYGTEFSGTFTAMQFTVDQPITLWNPKTGETEEMPAIYTGQDGYLYFNVEALEAATGIQVFISADGKRANLVTDAEYNQIAGGTGAGLNQTALSAREDVQRAANDYQVLVKQLEEAARQQAQPDESSDTEPDGGTSTPTEPSGTTSEPGGTSSEPDSSASKPETSAPEESSTDDRTEQGAKQEPTSGMGYDTAQRNDAVWDPELGGWVYYTGPERTKTLIRPNGAIRYIR